MALIYSFYIGGFLASIINPFWGLAALIVSVLIRFQDRFPEISSIKPFTLLFLGMVIGCFVNKEQLAKQDWKQDKLLLGLLLLSIFGLVAMNFGQIPAETWNFISALAFYYFASRILQEKKQFIILFSITTRYNYSKQLKYNY